jgi:outer membrane protein
MMDLTANGSAALLRRAAYASCAALAGLLALATPPAAADDRFVISLGLGAGIAPEYEGARRYEPVPLWNVGVSNLYHPATYARVVGTRFESNLLPSDHWRLGIVGQYLRDYQHVDDDAVSRLTRPENALLMGVVLGYDLAPRPREHYVLEVEAAYDALHGNGGLITPRLRAELPLAERLTLGGTLSASWASRDFMQNRFGVSAADAARTGLRPFAADSGFKDVAFSTSLAYTFAPRWSVSAIGSVRRLLGDAADSPIVADRGNRTNAFGGAIVTFRF